MPTGVEPAGQGQTPHGTASASGSQTPMVSEVPTSIVPIVPTPTVFTVPPTVYSAPPPMPTAHPTPALAAVVAPPPVPPPIVPPATPTYVDPTVPTAAPALAYAAAPGMPPPAYAANNRSVTEYNAEFNRLARFCPELIAEGSSRMLQFIQGLDGHLQVKLVSFGSSSYLETLDRALMIESAQQRVFPDRKRKQTGQTSRQI
ncbi:lysine-rich arabinogalactan protein 19-like [Zingiber officinale]|uniref:lysine-rich arabinogalactan protein 19-like n=1 Tax=Zingiber officinale TaxID=94328 RepID=UPI001C4CE5BA|nr:lysine-rich arabinogalactan protein 19-like [Zingiber officinale]